MLNANLTANELLDDLRKVSLEKEVVMKENEDLKHQLIKLGTRIPELQDGILPILDILSESEQEEPTIDSTSPLPLGTAMQAVYEDPSLKEKDTSSLDSVDDPNLPDIYVSEEEIVTSILATALHFPFVSEVYFEDYSIYNITHLILRVKFHWITLLLAPLFWAIAYFVLYRRINKIDTFGRVKIRQLGTTWRDENLLYSHTVKSDQNILDLQKDSYLDREFKLLENERIKKESVSDAVKEVRQNKVQTNEDGDVRTSEIVITGTDRIDQINKESEAWQR